MCIWVDADSCPVPVRELIMRFALRLSIETVFVANREIPFEKNPLFTMTICAENPDAADDYIVEQAKSQDLVITRDIPLAARLVKRAVSVLNDRGITYTEQNIYERLAIRNLNMELHIQGMTPARTGTLGKKELKDFANALDRILQKKMKQENV